MGQWGSIWGVCQKLSPTSRRGVDWLGYPKSKVVIRRDPDSSLDGVILLFMMLVDNLWWD